MTVAQRVRHGGGRGSGNGGVGPKARNARSSQTMMICRHPKFAIPPGYTKSSRSSIQALLFDIISPDCTRSDAYLQRAPHLLRDTHEAVGKDGEVHRVQLRSDALATLAVAFSGGVSDLDAHVS